MADNRTLHNIYDKISSAIKVLARREFQTKLFIRSATGLRSQAFQKSGNYCNDYDFLYCAYNGGENTHCAIGWLIDDIPFDQALNVDVTVEALCKYSPAVKDRLSFNGKLDLEFLDRLQRAHDRSRTPTEMWDNLQEVIIKFGLGLDATGALGPRPGQGIND